MIINGNENYNDNSGADGGDDGVDGDGNMMVMVI